MSKNITIIAVSVALDANGLGNDVTGASFTLTANDSGDDLAHLITILNNTANDHSGKTMAIVGTGPNGEAQTETITGPAGSATVTSTKYFLTVTSVTPSATIGADTMDIGWAVTSVSPWNYLNTAPEYFSVGFSCIVISGSPTYAVQHSHGGAYGVDHSSVTGETTSQFGSYNAPIGAIRLTFAAAGGVNLYAIQGGV